MNTTLLLPTIISALVSVLTVLLAPAAAARIKQRSQDRIDAAAVEIRRIDGQAKFYDDLRAELDTVRKALVAAQHDSLELTRRLIKFETDARAFDLRLSAIAEDVDDLRHQIEQHARDYPAAAALAEQATKILARIRKGDHLGRGA